MLLTPKEVAKRLRVSERTIYEWLKMKRLRGRKMGRLWRIPEEELDRFIKGGEEE